jgi:CubicO group peptidase (beta-lactamase class C family)
MIAALLVAAVVVAAAPAFPPATVTALEQAITDVVDDTPMVTDAGFALAVLHHGQHYRFSRGVVNGKTRQPATSSTSFRLASITKTFTALAVMQLVADGELSLDQPVRALVPQLPASSSSITVRHLLEHSSGIRHYPLKGKERAWNKHLSTSQTLSLFVDRPLAAPPGESFLYTSYGYDVLGALLEAHEHTSYADVIDDRICGPLGLAHTFVEDSRHRRRDWPVGLRVTNDGRVVRGDVIDLSSRFAGGGMRGTVDDLVVYAEALLHRDLVDDITWQQMTTPSFTTDGLQNDYGLGFAVYPQRGHLVVAHAGGQPETTSLLFLLPTEDLAVVMLTNLEGQGALQTDVAAAVVEVLLENAQPRRAIYADDPVDAVIAEALNRTFSHGLAFADKAFTVVDTAATNTAFSRFAALTDPAAITANPDAAREALRQAHHPKNGRVTVVVGATIARRLDGQSDRPARGPLAFFVDDVARCRRVRCPAEQTLPLPLVERLMRLHAAMSTTTAQTAARFTRSDLLDVQRVRPVLLALLGQPVRPDLHDDLVVVSDRLQRRGRNEDADTLRTLDQQLYPTLSSSD